MSRPVVLRIMNPRRALLIVALIVSVMSAQTAEAATRAGIKTPNAIIIYAECPDGGGACAIDTTLYLPSGTDAFTREHELGHAFDAEYLDAGERLALQHRIGLKDGPWDTGTGMTTGGYTSPSEWFADAYAACRLGLIPNSTHSDWVNDYGYVPTRRQHRIVCATIRRAGDST